MQRVEIARIIRAGVVESHFTGMEEQASTKTTANLQIKHQKEATRCRFPALSAKP